MATILYIDDDEHYAWLVKRLLGLYGLRVEVARDGLEGMRKARELDADLIMVNLYLPHFDGTELIRQLRSERATRDVPIVVISPVSPHHSQRLVQDLNVQDVISQPLRFDELTEMVYKYLYQRSANGLAVCLVPAGALSY
jgi:DNA-binding response OmpR family regulator